MPIGCAPKSNRFLAAQNAAGPRSRFSDFCLRRATQMRSGYNSQVSSSPVHAEAGDMLLHASSARRALSGLCLSGLLASLLGAILPAWGYHLQFQFSTIGYYFLSVALGVTA